MDKHKMSCQQIGEVVGRSEMTVRIWRCSPGHRVIPDIVLEVLENRLNAGAANVRKD
jgi:putative component of membrane protein insertase Oxa1/YidC/SpoIIIJ protein YidD